MPLYISHKRKISLKRSLDPPLFYGRIGLNDAVMDALHMTRSRQTFPFDAKCF